MLFRSLVPGKLDERKNRILSGKKKVFTLSGNVTSVTVV